MQATLTMTRSGEFEPRVMGSDHCGIANHNTPLKMRYEVVIECTASSRDRRGFLFDQLTVHNYFTTHQFVIKSCEDLAAVCAQDLLNLIHAENEKCRIKSIQVVISAAPFAANMRYYSRAPGKSFLQPSDFYRTRSGKLKPKMFKKFTGEYEPDDEGPF